MLSNSNFCIPRLSHLYKLFNPDNLASFQNCISISKPSSFLLNLRSIAKEIFTNHGFQANSACGHVDVSNRMSTMKANLF